MNENGKKVGAEITPEDIDRIFNTHRPDVTPSNE